MSESNGTTPDLVIHRAQRRVIGHLDIDGERYAVVSPPGSTYAKIKAAGTKPTLEQTWDAVQSLVPRLPREVLEDLSLEELNDIVGYAMNPVKIVEERAAEVIERLGPKEAGTETTQPLPSSLSTTSDTSPFESPRPLAEGIGAS